MEPVGIWGSLLLGALAVLVILWFRPGIQAAMEQSRRAEQKDWRSVLVPVGLVIVFVILLIAMARCGIDSN